MFGFSDKSDKKEGEKKPAISMTQLSGAVMKAVSTGEWSGVLDLAKPLLAPGIGGALLEHDKAGRSTNACFIITKKIDESGGLNVFISAIERPAELQYILDKEGAPIVNEIGDLMDIISK